MTDYLARLSSTEIGAALAIKSGRPLSNDRLSISLSDGDTIGGCVADISSDYLTIALDGMQLRCRPWKYGDRSINRFQGDNSLWIVESIPVLIAAE